MENTLAQNQGEYDSEYKINAGSYYEKAFTAMLMTESVDNFISASRRDFLDGRYRAVSFADLFPDSYRRWLSNNLTGDEALKGARVATDASGKPLVEGQEKFVAKPIGYVSWSKKTPAACFQDVDTIQCEATPTPNSVAIDGQVGWEQQKFLIAWTLLYLPENQQQTWLNQMNMWEIGADSDPGFANRIEFHSPYGKTYVAKTFGKEVVLGKTVQKGISARMLEWANELLFAAFETTNGPDTDADGKPDWYEVKLTNGQPRVKYDPTTLKRFNTQGQGFPDRPGCSPSDNSQCTCSSNRACTALSKYEELPFFMRQAMRDYGLAHPSMRGIY